MFSSRLNGRHRSFANWRPLVKPTTANRFRINDSTIETGKPVSASEEGSDGRNDSSAIIVASKLLIGEFEVELVMAIGLMALICSRSERESHSQ
jgi:hypothetical protein